MYLWVVQSKKNQITWVNKVSGEDEVGRTSAISKDNSFITEHGDGAKSVRISWN